MVKSASAEPLERRRFRKLAADYFDTFLRTVRLRALAGPITEVFVALGTAILLWYGARMVVVDGSLTGGEFVGFIFLSTKLYAPVKYLGKLPALIQPGLVGAERIFEFLDAPAEIRGPGGRPAVHGRGGRDPLPGRAHGIPSGRSGAAGRGLLRSGRDGGGAGGASGAGKTTVVDLLSRFYEPTAGAVEIGGTDIRDLELASLRGAMGVVSQDTVLFHDTVRANIAYGMEDAPLGRVEAAARAAYAHEFVTRLPEGYETVVGERGTALSGGQRQRIAIARAVLRDPPRAGAGRGDERARRRVGEARAGGDGGTAGGDARCSSSRTGSRRFGAPTASWCWTKGGSCSRALTPR